MHGQFFTDLGFRRDWLLHEPIHDPYKTLHKISEPICSGGGAVFQRGRLRWICDRAKPKKRFRRGSEP